MASQSVVNFMKQQGFPNEAASPCSRHFAGLSFQPRILGTLVVVGILLRAPALFLVLSAMLWWSVLVPGLNPFEVFYNRFVAMHSGQPMLGPAPARRRFAQGMAGTFLLIIGLALLQGWMLTAYACEVLVVVALSVLLFGKFCLGAYMYHLLRGETSFANSTLPWAKGR